MEDPKKITAKLDELNKNERGNPWIVVSGNHVIPEANAVGRQGFKFDYDRGYVVKMFVNIVTGEVKTFAIKHFDYQL